MTIITPGAAAPEFSLQREDGSRFTNADLAGKTVVLVFYPNAFSPVCTDQFQVYKEALAEITKDGAEIYRRLDRPTPPRRPRSARSSGSTIPMLSDFEPKGEACRALRRLLRARRASRNRALVIVVKDGVVAWSWLGGEPRASCPASTSCSTAWLLSAGAPDVPAPAAAPSASRR